MMWNKSVKRDPSPKLDYWRETPAMPSKELTEEVGALVGRHTLTGQAGTFTMMDEYFGEFRAYSGATFVASRGEVVVEGEAATEEQELDLLLAGG